MKKITFLLLMLLFFTSYAWSQCESAVALTPGTTQSGNTSSFGELFSDNSCLGSYDGGDDALFVYTASQTGETMNVSLTGADTWTGISMTLGCPTGSGYSCVGSSTYGSSQSFTSDPLVANETYYIHISTYPTPYTTDYNLDTEVVAAPACPDPTGLQTSLITTSSAELSWTAGDSETLWNIEVVDVTAGETADGSIDYTSSTNSYPLTSLSANNEYEVYVQADCGAGETSSWGGPVSFTTLCAAIVPDYTADMSNNPVDNCWKEANNGDAASGPTDLGSGLWYSSNHNGISSNAINLWQNVRSDWIISPSFDLSSSAPSELNVYVALTESSTSGSNADLGSDDSVSLLMTVDGGTTWTSLQTWTQGNVPTDIGEQITYDLSTITGTVQFAFLGDEGDLDDSEDVYFHVSQFRVRETPSCLEVSGLTTANITSSSAVLSWTADASQSLFNVEVVDVTNNESVTGTPTEFGVANPYTLTGLTANNEYEVYVQADCGGSDTSSWVGPVSFTTLCEAVTEFSENFDGVTSSTFPNCWGKIGSSGSVYLSTSYDNSAPNALYLYSSSTSNLAVVGMTPVSNLGAGTHRFTFNMRANFTSGGIVEIGYLTDGNDPDSFISLGNVVSNSTSYESYSFIPPAGTYTNYPAMRHTGSPAYSVSIDDVVWEEIPSCLAPTAITVSEITDCCADISWAAGDSETDYEYVVQAAGTGEPTIAGIAVTGSTTVSVGPLAANTDFEVYVRSNCGANGFSAWAGPVNFTTEPAPIVPNYTNDFSTFPGEFWSEGSGALNAGPAGSTSSWIADGFGNSGTTGAARINLYGTKNEWLISPTFDLSSGTFYLNVDAAATEFASTAAANFGADDIVILLASTDNGVSWEELYEWNATTDPGPTGTGLSEITLENYTATSKFAFYGNATSSSFSEDVDFFVDNFQITSTSLGIEENNISLFNYFPNPVNDVLTIKAQKDVDNITVYNMLGQVVIRQTPNTRDCTVDLSTMQTGAYFVQVSIDNSVETIRILKN